MVQLLNARVWFGRTLKPKCTKDWAIANGEVERFGCFL